MFSGAIIGKRGPEKQAGEKTSLLHQFSPWVLKFSVTTSVVKHDAVPQQGRYYRQGKDYSCRMVKLMKISFLLMLSSIIFLTAQPVGVQAQTSDPNRDTDFVPKRLIEI